jgi:uncharacterized repeat protein (TIGR01451 family)
MSAVAIGNIGYVGFGAYDPVIAYNDFYAYDNSTDTWTQLPSLPGSGRFDGISFTLNSKFYAGCGYNYTSYLKDMWSYDPFTNSWTQENDFGGAARYANMSINVGNIAVAGLGRSAGYYNDLWEFSNTNPNVINGLVFRDDNANAIPDSNEVRYRDLIIQVAPSGNLYCTDTYGHFNASADTGVNTVSIPNLPPYYTLSPASNTINFPASGLVDTTTSFGLVPIGTINDLSLIATPLTPPKPGNAEVFNLACKNNGTTIVPVATLQAILDPATAFYQLIPNDTNLVISNDTLTITVYNLQPGDDRTYMVYTNVSTSSTIGDTVHLSYSILPLAGDSNPSDNVSADSLAVVSSFDPNDISVTPAGSISPMQVVAGTWLTYTIRFQNTGTANADIVKVLDSISTNLDLGSLQVLAASHTFHTILNGDRVLKFEFSNIQLPPTSSNEPGSHGFVTYRIKAKNNLMLGDQIVNQAGIYFDYNPPVITNQAITTVASAAGLPEFDATFSISPNPAKDEIRIIGNNVSKIKGIRLYDLSGRLVSYDLKIQNSIVKIPALSTGFYTLKVDFENNRSSTNKLIIQQ